MNEIGVVIGVTGTREGMTDEQRADLQGFCVLHRVRGLRHGDCIGVDAQAHEIAMNGGIPIVIHPPADTRYRAYCHGATVVKPEKPYLERNHDIVDDCDVLFAYPKGDQEELRSGTWSTVRYAQRVGKPCIVVFPDGRKKVYRGTPPSAD